ncbi:FHA domain-containing protein [archaeon]|jgi:hypothetical protein|nr:FHA domain-containing protein [archaeon]MBT4397405.1 FHA domain-containing protein [archaeon]MBT4440477.1 FHA domain-containing protein [archaeon]
MSYIEFVKGKEDFGSLILVYKNSTIGREGKGADVEIREGNDESNNASVGISRKHAKITIDGVNGFCIEPIARNVVIVNHRIINYRTRLKIGDLIQLGKDTNEFLRRPFYLQVEVICYGIGDRPVFANLKFNRIAERAGFKILGDYLMVGTNKWTFMDRNNKSKKLFDEYCPCETVTKKDIKANRPWRMKTQLKQYFKIYFYFNDIHIFEEFEKVVRAINDSGVDLVSGKVALEKHIYGNLRTAKVILYVIGEGNKDKLLRYFKRIKFNPESKQDWVLFNKKQENDFLAWNQGGDGVRFAARDVGKLMNFFHGENQHLINP